MVRLPGFPVRFTGIDASPEHSRTWMMSATTRDLVAAASTGDREAWAALIQRHTGLLWSVARSFRLPEADAADVVQTTWLRLVEHLDRIDDPDRLPGWLATTVRHECLRLVRRAGHEAYGSAADEVADDGPSLDSGVLTTERDAALWEALAQLDEPCRQLLRVLMTDPPPTYAAVSMALDMPMGSIGPRRTRCLSKLRRMASISQLADGADTWDESAGRGR
jgi:RNA polymerase sigma factor (sigma-70 family)